MRERAPAAAHFIHPANLLTYVSLLAGLGAIVAAHELAQPALPAALLALGVFADTFDGRFARLFQRSDELRAFGGQIDSLSDAVVFGVAPVLVIYLTGLTPTLPSSLAWWGAAGFYLVCVLTRLGAYNLHSADNAGFVGVPAPVAALVLASALLLDAGGAVSGALLFACGVAMIAPLPIGRPGVGGLTIFAAWALAILCWGSIAGLASQLGGFPE